VDKTDFLHRLKGLRAFQSAEQALFLAGTLTGQKLGCVQVGQFRTFGPVDMQGLIHNAPGFGWQTGSERDRGRLGDPGWPGRSRFALRSAELPKPDFFLTRSALSKVLVRFTTKSLYTE
jgi:hypothetical protein